MEPTVQQLNVKITNSIAQQIIALLSAELKSVWHQTYDQRDLVPCICKCISYYLAKGVKVEPDQWAMVINSWLSRNARLSPNLQLSLF